MFRTRLTRRPGASGTKKLVREYGERLVAVRYRYDEERGERMKTVELAVETVPWRQNGQPGRSESEKHVCVRLRPGEDLLRRALLLAQCRYDAETGTWSVSKEIARSLGLADRTERTRSRSKTTYPIADRKAQR